MHADDLDARVALLDAGGYAADECGVAHRDVDCGDQRELPKNFEADGGGARGQVGVGGVVEEVDAGTARVLFGFLEGVGKIRAADFDDLCSEIDDALALDGIGIRGKKNGGTKAESFCGEGHGGTVIARAGGGDFFDGAAAKIDGQSVERATRLEGGGGKLEFELEMELHFGAVESGTWDERRKRQIGSEELLCFVDGGEG